MVDEHSETQHSAEQALVHEPLELTSVDAMPMVKCSCDGDDPRRIRWQSAYWLQEHWQGDQTSGVLALNALATRQGREARDA